MTKSNKNSTKNVLVVAPGTLNLESIFPEYGYKAWRSDEPHEGVEFEFIAFPGGADINPKLYQQKPIPGTYFNNARDLHEIALYHKYKHLKKLGICRGGQLLNVLNGGSMYQDVNNHGHRPHTVVDIEGKTWLVSSVHHQMMIPNADSKAGAKVIAWASLATYKTDQYGTREIESHDPSIDPEVIFYPKDKALCFQGHPEFGPKPCTDYFFKLVEEYLS